MTDTYGVHAAAMRKVMDYDCRLLADIVAKEAEIEYFLQSGAMIRDISIVETPQMMRIERNGMRYDMVPIRNWRMA